MPYLSVRDVCERLNCSRFTVVDLIKGGELAAIKGSGRTSPYKIEQSDLDDYIERSRVIPETEAAAR